MKANRILLTVVFITTIFLCSGLVSALNSEEAAAHALFSNQLLSAGQTETVTIFFSSTSVNDLVITNVGIHFDWLPEGSFLGYDLSSAPAIVSNGETYPFQEMAIKIPTNIASGSHSYYIGVDGTEGPSSTPFSWNSVTSTIEVIGGGASTSPSSTNSGGEQPEGQPNFLLYGAILAIVVIVALLIIAFVVRKKRAQPKSNTDEGADQPETPSSEQKSDSEQDFSI